MKINNKHYYIMSKAIETNDLDIIYEYIKDKKRISEENQDKLVKMAISSKDPDFIIKLAYIIQNLKKTSYKSDDNIEKLADAIIEMNISDYILDFSCFIYKMSIEKQNKLVDALIKSKSKYYYAYMDPLSGNVNGRDFEKAKEESYKACAYPISRYICEFVHNVSWLSNDNIEKLADTIISTQNIRDICEFLKHTNISSEKMLELEKYILQNYKKVSIAKILKKLKNIKLINLIYGSESVLDNFLLDFEKFENDNLNYASQQMQDYGFNSKGVNRGGVSSTSGFIPREQLKIIGYRKKTADELLEKYKFVDDNIKKVLSSNIFIEEIDNTDEVQKGLQHYHLQKEKGAVLKKIKNAK